MKRYPFLQVDVFTEVPFGGNPLAVFTEAAGLSAEEMQKIAREMNLSETTFILTPEHPRADFKVRIFTPRAEIPFAGHPVIGTAHALAEKDMVKKPSPVTALRLELGVGLVPVEITEMDEEGSKVTMHQRLPHFMDCPVPISALSGMLNIDADTIQSTGFKPRVISTGLPFLIVPVDCLDVIQSVELNYALMKEYRDVLSQTSLALYTRETVDDTAAVHVRVFAPEFGVPEDPVTGSAAGCFGAFLVDNGILPAGKPFVIEQGLEAGRPGKIEVEIRKDKDKISDVLVSGRTVTILDGAIKFYG